MFQKPNGVVDLLQVGSFPPLQGSFRRLVCPSRMLRDYSVHNWRGRDIPPSLTHSSPTFRYTRQSHYEMNGRSRTKVLGGVEPINPTVARVNLA